MVRIRARGVMVLELFQNSERVLVIFERFRSFSWWRTRTVTERVSCSITS